MSETVTTGIDEAAKGRKFGRVLYSTLENYRTAEIRACVPNLELDPKDWDCVWKQYDELSNGAEGVDSRFHDGAQWHRFETMESKATTLLEAVGAGGRVLLGTSPQSSCSQDRDGNPQLEECGEELYGAFVARWRECKSAMRARLVACRDQIASTAPGTCQSLGACSVPSVCEFDHLSAMADTLPPTQLVTSVPTKFLPTFEDFGPFVGTHNIQEIGLGRSSADYLCVPSEIRGKFAGTATAQVRPKNGEWTVAVQTVWYASGPRERVQISVRCVPIQNFIHGIGDSVSIGSDFLVCSRGACSMPLGSFPAPPALPPPAMIGGIGGHWSLVENWAQTRYTPQTGSVAWIETLFDFEERWLGAVVVDRSPSALETVLPARLVPLARSTPSQQAILSQVDVDVSPADAFCFLSGVGAEIQDAAFDFVSIQPGLGPTGLPTWVLSVNGGLKDAVNRRLVVGDTQCVRW